MKAGWTPILVALMFMGAAARAAEAPDAPTLELALPPAELGRWYKPQAPRNQWLHLMFALRRELQAVADYAAAGDQTRARRWFDRLAHDYRRIGEMVPEWRDELELALLDRMQAALDDPDELARLQRRLQHSCQGCHREYQLSAGLLYRGPDFDAVKAGGRPFDEAMTGLSQTLNRIIIAFSDSRWTAARQALAVLRRDLDGLAESCTACHRDAAPKARILGPATRKALEALDKALARQDAKGAARPVGEFAVAVCARCHAIHRPLAQLKRLLQRQQGR